MMSKLQLKSDALRKIRKVVDSFSFDEKDMSVFIFGSRANSKATVVSDIDIGIVAAKNVPASLIQDFRDALENLPIFYKFDVVDFSKTSKGFRHHALKNIFPLN